MNPYVRLRAVMVLAVMAMCGTSYGQSSQASFSADLSKIQVIVLRTEGNTWITNATADTLHAITELNTSGKVIGVKVPGERKPLEFKYFTKADTLYLKTPPYAKYSMIGLSTYKEVLQHNITIPASKKLIVEKSGDLEIKGQFNFLDVQKTEHLRMEFYPAVYYRTLVCQASMKLVVDDKRQNNQMVYHGQGDSIYQLAGDKITVVASQ